MKGVKSMIVTLAAALLIPAAAAAQKVALDLNAPDLAAKAVETVEVTLDGPLLAAAGRFLANAGPDERRMGNLVRKLEGIYVRSYTFAEEGAYDRVWIEKFRARIGPGWQRIVRVQKAGSENVEIYTHLRGDVIHGLVVIAAEPKELTFVNVVGPIDLTELALLEGQFGIPKVSGDIHKVKE